MEKGVILAICGKSATGKSTLASYLQQWMVAYGKPAMSIISATTRPPRDNEKNGVDYFFMTKEQFEKKIGHHDFLEYAEFRGWYYGTPLSSLSHDRVNILVVNPQGLESLLYFQDEYDIIPVYLEESFEVRLERSYARENKMKFEYIRRAIVDFFAFIGIKKLIRKFPRHIIFSRGSSITIEINSIMHYLISLGVIH